VVGPIASHISTSSFAMAAASAGRAAARSAVAAVPTPDRPHAAQRPAQVEWPWGGCVELLNAAAGQACKGSAYRGQHQAIKGAVTPIKGAPRTTNRGDRSAAWIKGW